ncbi:DUF1854 domain-containing protein [Sphaerotilus sp.]|uniref:cyanophycin metabolism-associated DUF1854 family protein n=1 Tax=Sphaerotilus sp. TaxID=2093942 RepID=UPI00286DFE6B|nr:DUF1854 domain-containing protein [Sphaerotilus sp.]
MFQLDRHPSGRLAYTGEDGATHHGVTPVRAFPVTAPDAGLSLVSAEGHELVWVDRLDALPDRQRTLIEEELAHREFMPEIRRVVSVSTFSTPSTWTVETDRGPTTLVLKVEEDIRRLPERGRLLITSGHGIVFTVRDMAALDRHSRKLMERFL